MKHGNLSSIGTSEKWPFSVVQHGLTPIISTYFHEFPGFPTFRYLLGAAFLKYRHQQGTGRDGRGVGDHILKPATKPENWRTSRSETWENAVKILGKWWFKLYVMIFLWISWDREREILGWWGPKTSNWWACSWESLRTKSVFLQQAMFDHRWLLVDEKKI